jgi:hypothetical protein
VAESGGGIRVTAVVTAHDRRGFLPAAVRSARDAGADEVIVVRNFDGEITGCEGAYRDIYCATPDTNEKEARGLEAAQGDIVGFLDDDDLWTPEKGARMRAQFAGDPTLVYLCHAQRAIDAEGHPVAASHREWASKRPESFPQWDGSDFGALVLNIWPGNNSSTVVRRSWAIDWIPPFRKAGWSADIFWLVAALASHGRVWISPDPLTWLRLHDANMSQTRGSTREEFRRRHETTSERFARSHATMTRLASEHLGPNAPMTAYLQDKADGFRFFADLEADRHPRRAALLAVRAKTGRNDPGVRRAALLALGSPALARRLLYRSSLRRWNLT